MSSVSIPAQLSALLPQSLSNQIPAASGIDAPAPAAPALPLSPAAGLRLSGLAGAQALGLAPPRGGVDLEAMLAAVTTVLQEAAGSNEAAGRDVVMSVLRQALADSRTQIVATNSLSIKIETDTALRDAKTLEVADATTRREGHVARRDHAQGQIGVLERRIQANDGTMAANRESIAGLRGQLSSAAASDKPRIEAQIRDLEAENTRLSAQNNSDSGSIEGHKRTIALENDMIVQLDAQIETLTGEIARLDQGINQDKATWAVQMDLMIDTALALMFAASGRRKDDSHESGQPAADLEEGLRAMIEAMIDRDGGIVVERGRAIMALDGAGGSGPLGDGVATRFGAIEAMQSRGAGFAATVEALVGMLARLDPEAMIRNAADLAAAGQTRTRIAM